MSSNGLPCVCGLMCLGQMDGFQSNVNQQVPGRCQWLQYFERQTPSLSCSTTHLIYAFALLRPSPRQSLQIPQGSRRRSWDVILGWSGFLTAWVSYPFPDMLRKAKIHMKFILWMYQALLLSRLQAISTSRHQDYEEIRFRWYDPLQRCTSILCKMRRSGRPKRRMK